MDPFLEHPDIFPDLHDSLNTYLREFLQAKLPAPYFAAIGRRAWIEVTQRYIGPDVNVLRSPSPSPPRAEAGAGVAVASAPSIPRPVVVRVPHDECRETFVDIFEGRGQDKRLVTTIEVLSLANKTPGAHGRDLYRRKQREILRGKVHLVEIDLLRAGEHTTAVPFELAVAKAGSFDYHVCIHHFDNLEDFFVYPIRLEERLPPIAIPLLPGDASVEIDLQEVFNRCYDTGPYRREIRYLQDTPIPPLRPEQAVWSARILEGAFGASRPETQKP
jgi:hypothetical protein